jgi:hypothetical protein
MWKGTAGYMQQLFHSKSLIHLLLRCYWQVHPGA